jgi:HTH-type transcriptional regulator, glycine betaine synthesis regulator
MDEISQTELDVADTVGRLMHFWGFKRPMGRTWTLLYLSSVPLGAAEVAEQLKMSAGAVSMTLGELLKWGVVKKTWRPGERRDFYEAETDIWKLVRRVLRERELTLVQEVGAALESARTSLAHAAMSKKELEFKRARIGRLRQLASVGETLLKALAAGEAVDPAPIAKVVGGVR